MQCPSCKEPIDNDSRYCDECGVQIKICPVCGKPGKGKFCTQDQSELVPAGSAPQAQQTAAQKSQPSALAPAMAYNAPVKQYAAAGDTIKFTQTGFAGAGIMFDAKDGDIIGRKNGSFISQFSSLQEVSGTHCKVVKLPGSAGANGWHIQDLGSTNGTFVQGNKIAPNVPYPLSNGAAVKIAIFDFTVSFEEEDGGTKRL